MLVIPALENCGKNIMSSSLETHSETLSQKKIKKDVGFSRRFILYKSP
jgi:hypothetical protein